MSHRLLAIAAIALIAAGCAGAGRTAHSRTPAWMERAAPRGYRVQHVWHANLTGGHVRDIVVSSIGPRRKHDAFPGSSSDLRVLVWHSHTHDWRLAFDAQKVVPTTACTPASSPYNCSVEFLDVSGTPLLDPEAVDSVGSVQFAHLVSRRRDDLIFSAETAAGSATPITLAIVHFDHGYPILNYTWSGAHGLRWHVANRKIYGETGDYRYAAAECCPVRSYHFTVAPRGEFGDFTETSDDRAWLGITTRWSPRELQVAGIEPNSPVRNQLRVGDVLLRVLKPPYRRWPGITFPQEIGLLHAGETARLLVTRDGRRISVTVRLGSLKDSVPDLLSFDSRIGDL